MRAISVFLLALCGVVSIAQNNMLGAQSRFQIVMMPESKKELRLTKEQEKQLQEVVKNANAEMQSGGLTFDLANPMAMFDPKLEPILDDAQKQRLEEMFLWVNGGFSLLDKRVAERLELSDEQRDAVKTLESERKKEMMQAIQAGPSGYKGLQKKADECGAKMLALLMPEQAKKYEALKGKPFKFRKP